MGGGEHFSVGIKGVDPISMSEKQFGKNTGASANVCQDVFGCEPGMVDKVVEESARIMGAAAVVVMGAMGEEVAGMGQGYFKWRCWVSLSGMVRLYQLAVDSGLDRAVN